MGPHRFSPLRRGSSSPETIDKWSIGNTQDSLLLLEGLTNLLNCSTLRVMHVSYTGANRRLQIFIPLLHFLINYISDCCTVFWATNKKGV